MKVNKIYFVIILYLFAQSVSANLNEKESVRRIALFVASNDGGEGREVLRYAESDALSISKVFEELGGLSPLDSTILLSPSKDGFQHTLDDLAVKFEEQNTNTVRTEFVFYYSGHSDGEGLMLRDGKMSYRDLRDSLKEIKSDVQIAILDSCQSGVFTRLKGGERVVPFLMNAANRVSGNVFLSASSENEAAQESDKIGGSFFTHHFVSALRGASDVSNDKQVTLNEAYQYAFNQTLENTENSQAGAQHPAYNFQIAGAGDLVLTDIKLASSTLVIPENILGRIFVRDLQGGLVIELKKVRRKSLTVGLEPGGYSVILESNSSLFQSEIKLISRESLVLKDSDFISLVVEKHRSRGAGNEIYSPVKQDKGYFFSVGYILSTLRFEGGYSTFSGGPELENQFPDVNKEYAGYELSFSKKFTDKMEASLNYFDSQGWGRYTGLSTMLKTSLYKKRFSPNDDVRVYYGIGIFGERLRDFPKELELINRHYEFDGYHLRNNEELGVILPFGLSGEKAGLRFSAEVRAKFAYRNNSLYKNKSRLTIMSLSIGYAI